VRAFRSRSKEYTASIAIDASTYGNVTTAVAVAATREEEVEILDRIYSASRDQDVLFIPFKSKSSNFSKEDDTGFFSQVIADGEPWLKGLHFRHHSASRNQHYVEAVLGAILLKDIQEAINSEPFVLVDGDTNKVKTLAKACGGIGIGSPTIANCYKSEWYYPHSLLADLSAGYLSWQIDCKRYDYSDPLLRVPPANRIREEDWGKAFNFLQRKQNQPGYNHLQLGSTSANRESERARIWYDGLVARGKNSGSAATSLSHIASRVEEMGYEDLSKCLSSL